MSLLQRIQILTIFSAIATGCGDSHKKTQNDANLKSLQIALESVDPWGAEFPDNPEKLKTELVRKGVIHYWPKDPWGRPYNCEIIKVHSGQMIVRISGGGEAIIVVANREIRTNRDDD